MHRFKTEFTKGVAGLPSVVFLSCRLPDDALRHTPANAPDYISRHTILIEPKLPYGYRAADAVTTVRADTVREALVEYLLASFATNYGSPGYCAVMTDHVLPRLAIELNQASEEIDALFIADEKATS